MNKIIENKVYMFTLEMYEFQFQKRQRFKFLNPGEYNKINGSDK